MRCHYICGHVRCKTCTYEERGPRAYFRCCRCAKLCPISRTGNKHNNRTKQKKRKPLDPGFHHEQLKILPNSPIWITAPRPTTKEKRP